MTDILEIQDLKDCLAIEQEEKNELNKKVQDLEKECEGEIAFGFSRVQIVLYVTWSGLLWPYKQLHANDLFVPWWLVHTVLVSRSQLVEQKQDSNSTWQVEMLKTKIMKLRKENEILKRKILHSDKG